MICLNPPVNNTLPKLSAGRKLLLLKFRQRLDGANNSRGRNEQICPLQLASRYLDQIASSIFALNLHLKHNWCMILSLARVNHLRLANLILDAITNQEVINSPALILLPSGSEVAKPRVFYEFRIKRSECVYKVKF